MSGVVNRTKTVEVTLTIGTDAYTAGDVVGGLIALDVIGVGNGGVVRRVMLVDDDNEKAAFKLHLFDAAPTTIADDAAYAPSVSDLKKQVGTVSISSYTTYNGNAIAIVEGVDIDYSIDNFLYGYLVCDGTPTYTAATDLTLRMTVWLGTLYQDAGITPVTANGQSVYTWRDGVQGVDAVQATGAKRPTYITDSLNGLPVLSFDGGDLLTTTWDICNMGGVQGIK